MDEKFALLDKMKKELEYKRKKLNRFQQSIKIKNHIQNKISKNEVKNFELNSNDLSKSANELFDTSQDNSGSVDILSTASSPNKAFDNCETNYLENTISVGPINNLSPLSLIINNSTANTGIVKYIETSRIAEKSVATDSHAHLIGMAYDSRVYNEAINKEPINILFKRNEIINRDNQNVSFSVVDSTNNHDSPLDNCTENLDKDMNAVNDDSILHFVDDIIALENPDDIYRSQNVVINCGNFFTKFEEDKYFIYKFNEKKKLIKHVGILKNLCSVFYENTFSIFSFDNCDFKLIYQWTSQMNNIKYVSFISDISVLVVLKDSDGINLILVHQIVFPYSFEFVASNRLWNSEISHIICNPTDNLFFIATNSISISHNHSRKSYISYENIIEESILEINMTKKSDIIHTVISKLNFKKFDETVISDCVTDFRNILAMTFINTEPLLCLCNHAGYILLWDYSTETQLHIVDTLYPFLALSEHSYLKEGLFFIGYTLKSCRNILVINPSTNKYLSLFSNQHEKFICWSLTENLKILRTSDQIIFNKLSTNTTHFVIESKSSNSDEEINTHIFILSENTIVALFSGFKLDLILIK